LAGRGRLGRGRDLADALSLRALFFFGRLSERLFICRILTNGCRKYLCLPLLAVALFVLVLCALTFYLYGAFKKKYFFVDLWTVALVLLFTVLSFASRRNFPLFIHLFLPFLLVIFPALFKTENKVAFGFQLVAENLSGQLSYFCGRGTIVNINGLKIRSFFSRRNYPYAASPF